jgi:SAM-dependent methyltransferase
VYYREDLARIHHLGFGSHADQCAPGILDLLESVRGRHGVVVELGCGSGALTRHLTAAGHRVIATDASPAMIALVRSQVPGADGFQFLTLPDDPIPEADAIVSVGHVLNYLPDETSIERGLAAICRALRPGGVLAFDICDLRWAEVRLNDPPRTWIHDEWVLITRFSVPTPNRFVREMTTFVRERDDAWRRDDERHENVLVDTSRLPELLYAHGVQASIGSGFGVHQMPPGLVTITGRRL